MNAQTESVLMIVGLFVLCVVGVCSLALAAVVSEIFHLSQFGRAVLSIVYFFMIGGYLFYAPYRHDKKMLKDHEATQYKRKAESDRLALVRLASDFSGSRKSVKDEAERTKRRASYHLDDEYPKKMKKTMKCKLP